MIQQTTKRLDEVIRETLSLTGDVGIEDSHGPGQLDGWDSLGHVQIVSALEAAYDISIQMDEVLSLETVRNIKDLLLNKNVANFE